MSEAVFSDAETNDIIHVFDVVPSEQGTNGVEVRHGAGVSTMVGPRLPRRVHYNATLVTPGMPDRRGRTAQIVNEALLPVRPFALLRQIEDALLGKTVHIDSAIQPHRDVKWVVEFVNPSVGEQDGSNVIHVQIAAIEEFDHDAVFDVVAIKLPVAPQMQEDADAEPTEPQPLALSGVPIGAGGICKKGDAQAYMVGAQVGSTLGATARGIAGAAVTARVLFQDTVVDPIAEAASRVGESSIVEGVGGAADRADQRIEEEAKKVGRATGEAVRKFGRTSKKFWKGVGAAIYGTPSFAQGVEDGYNLKASNKKGACRQ